LLGGDAARLSHEELDRISDLIAEAKEQHERDRTKERSR